MTTQEIEVTHTVSKKITRCWNTCPHYGLDMNTMVCNHPEAENSGYIIEHPQCMNGFPDKCPLIIQQY